MELLNWEYRDTYFYAKFCNLCYERINEQMKRGKHTFSMARQPLVGLGLLIVETSWSHSDTPHSVGLRWTRDQPVAETSTWQRTILQETDIHDTGGIRTRNPSKRAAEDPRHRPGGHWDWAGKYTLTVIYGTIVLRHLLFALYWNSNVHDCHTAFTEATYQSTPWVSKEPLNLK
jgi:hypothetical protein